MRLQFNPPTGLRLHETEFKMCIRLLESPKHNGRNQSCTPLNLPTDQDFFSNRKQKHNGPGYSYHVITKTFPPQGPFLPDQFKPGQFFPSVTFGRFFPSSALLVNMTRCIAKVMAKTIPTCGPISHTVNNHLFIVLKEPHQNVKIALFWWLCRKFGQITCCVVDFRRCAW